MTIKEYRIPLPFTIEEYRIAQPYMVAKVSKEQSGHGEGVEILENRPYTEEEGKGPAGQFTHKVFRIGSRLPGWLKAFIPPSALQVEERAWNSYPFCKTVHSAPILGDRFSISIETRYLEDKGTTENPFNLSPEELKERGEVDVVNIVTDPIDPAKYKPEEDPALYVSEKSGRGKLPPDWVDTTKPIMCSYKLCKVEFRVWGLQSRAEAFIHKAALRDVFFDGHRKIFCWMDEWFGFSMDDVRRYEAKAQVELNTMAHEARKELDGADQ